MAYSTRPDVDIGAGVFIGFWLGGLLLRDRVAAFGKLVPEPFRPIASASGRLPVHSASPLIRALSVPLSNALGGQITLITFAILMLLVLPCRSRSWSDARTHRRRAAAAVAPAGALGGVVASLLLLLVLGFFTCGFSCNSSQFICRAI